MTQDKMPTRTIMPCPFAGGEGAALATIGQTSGDTVNFQQGFPSVYGAPASLGGKYVKRSEMNAIGNLATNDLFYKRCGGLNTFDAKFCEAVGGYPKGAVLDHVVNGLARRVMSLKDNNTVDFTQYGVDGIKSWRYCDVEPIEQEKTVLLDERITLEYPLSSSSQGIISSIFGSILQFDCRIIETANMIGFVPSENIKIEAIFDVYVQYREPNSTTKKYMISSYGITESDATYRPYSLKQGTEYIINARITSGSQFYIDVSSTAFPL